MGAMRNPGVIWKALDEAARGVPNDRMYIYQGPHDFLQRSG